MSDDIRVLNLYAGIGGNRKLWDGVDVTAVEWDSERANIYRDYFPNDTVVEMDAHEYLLESHSEFDFIWASPPCPTHSRMRKLHTTEREQNDPVYPDMNLYQEILFLRGYFEGDWVVENVDPYYKEMFNPQKKGRHLFWCNFSISDIVLEATGVCDGDSVEEHEERLGFDLSGYDLGHDKKLKMLRNCVEPELGEHVLKSRSTKQQTIPGIA